MNKSLLWLNIFLLIAVGILLFLFYTRLPGQHKSSISGNRENNPDASQVFRMAYFDMDSIEANFSLFKEMQTAVSKMEDSMNNVINKMKNSFQRKYEKFQADRFRLSPEQLDSAGMELSRIDNEIKMRNSELNQVYQTFYMNKQQEIISYIKKYCDEFNKDGRFSFIIANEPGLVYYKDTAYNITAELLKGLNQYYDSKKKK